MARRTWLLTVGLALNYGAVCGCMRTAEKAVPAARQLTSRSTESRLAQTSETGVYAAMPAPLAPTPPSVKKTASGPDPTRDADVGTDAAVASAKGTDARKVNDVAELEQLNFPKAKPPSEHPLVTALQCRLDKRPEEARRLLETYDPARQDFLFALLGLVARFADPVPHKPDSPCAGELIDDLKGLLDPLRCRAPLKIEKICFCQRIKTYGVYEPIFERPQFRPDDRVPIYVELRNFSSVEQKMPNGEARHVIKLTSSYEIHDEQRKLVHEDVFLRDRDAADESRTARQDYFENYVFMVPRLKPGFYTLWIKIEDVGTHPSRTVKASLDFHVPNLPVQVSRGTS